MDRASTLSPNSLAFIALCNEFCATIENAPESDRDTFISSMLKILPRLYISASDLSTGPAMLEDFYITSSLEEDYYDSLRRGIEYLLGADDTYLEVFERDMKYSDTPIAASVSENLSDIFQSCYNFVEMIKDAPQHVVDEALAAMKEDFETYWSGIICNVMRPLNQLRYNPEASAEY